MKQFFFIILAGFILALNLSACTSLSGEIDPLTPSQSFKKTGMLPPQSLAEGSCGLFVWTADTQNKFIGFETDGRAKYIVNDKIRLAKRRDNGALNALKRTYGYSDGADLPPITFQLLLERDKEIADGDRFYGRLSTKTEDGWDRVAPIAALLSCAAQ